MARAATVIAPLDDEVDAGLLLGAVQSLGYRRLPLMQFFVTDGLSIDADASWAIDLDSGDVRDRYLGGFSSGRFDAPRRLAARIAPSPGDRTWPEGFGAERALETIPYRPVRAQGCRDYRSECRQGD